MDVKAHFGCGLTAPIGWRNFDTSPTLRLSKVMGRFAPGPKWPKNAEYGNIVKGLPLPANSCSLIYSSHVLEHLALEDFRHALLKVHYHLKPNGKFRFVLPDLTYLAKRYLETGDSHEFMINSHLGITSRAKGLSGFLRDLMGNSKHLWMWDLASMTTELQKAGFSGIRSAVPGDSPEFSDVEEADRFENCLGMECRK
jgi:hypothetical protein